MNDVAFTLMIPLLLFFQAPVGTAETVPKTVSAKVNLMDNMCSVTGSADPEGTLYDSGGEFGPYQDGENCSFLIDPGCALSLTLDFSFFESESCCDDLFIYDGPDQNAPLLLTHSGSVTPAPVVANSGMAYIVFSSDGSVTAGGFEMHWTAEIPSTEPTADFSIGNNNPPLNTPVQFVDQSSNSPNHWSWDFGDGNTSTEQNPFHTYTTPGTYNIQLVVDNCFDTDTISKMLTVQDAPAIVVDSEGVDITLECGQDTTISFALDNMGTGTLLYDITQLGGSILDSSQVIFEVNGAITNHQFSGISPLTDMINLQIVLNGDFGSSTESAELYIDGDLIGQIEDGDVGDGVDVVVNYQFDAETIAPWIANGTVEVFIQNTNSVSPFGGLALHQVTLEAITLEWLSFSPTNGTLFPGESTTVTLEITTEDLVVGSYEEAITITSNDPNNASITRPVNLQVVGDPAISFSTSCLDFPTTMQYRSNSLPLVITNTGCASLYISGINSPLPTFELSFNELFLEPGQSDTLIVTYSPTAVDTISADLEFVNNALPATVCLTASSFPAPVILSDSTQIEVELFGCSDSLIVPLTIANNGDSDLSYRFSSGSPSGNLPLDSVRHRLNNAFEEITNLLPGLFLFSDGELGESIFDGGGDMYDGGNYLSINGNFDPLPYSNDMITTNMQLGDGGQYFTRKFPGLFVFAADVNNINSFEVTGDVGADGSGFVTATELNYSDGLNSYTGFVKKIHDAFDPSIHHLIIAKNADGVVHTYDTDPVTDFHQISGLNNIERIYYLLFAESTGAEYSNAQVEAVMIKFLELVEEPTFLELPEGMYSLAPDQSEIFQLTFNSTDRIDGSYQQNITITSNDPLEPTLTIPVTMTIFGEPEIVLSDTCLDFPATMQYRTSALPLIISNPGCDTLLISDIVNEEPAFSFSFSQTMIEPGESDTVVVTFAPVVAGEFNSQVELINDATPSSFCLTASSFDAPSIQTDPESLALDLFSCADTVTLPITVLNEGAGPLEYGFVGVNTPDGNLPLDSVRLRLNTSFNEITGLLPNLFLFEDGVEGNNISDGGNDMYDGGNFLQVDDGFNSIPYADDMIQGLADLGNGGQYFTRKFPGLFLFAADLNGVSTFRITGNLGADGDGQVVGSEINIFFNGANYKGFVKKVHGTSDPSVNHLVIVKNPDGVTRTFDASSQTDDHEITGLEEVTRMYYLLFAGTNGQLYTDAQIRAVMLRFLEIAEEYGFADLPEDSFILDPGQSEVFNIPFYSQNTFGGTYVQNLVIYSDDPLQPILEVPVTVNVSLDLCANFEFSRPIECGGQINFESTTINTPTSYLWDFGDGNTSTASAPSHYYATPGTYNVVLTVNNEISSDVISKVVEIDETSAPVAACEVNASNQFPYAEISAFSLNTIDNPSGSNNSSYTDFTCDFSTLLTVGVQYEVTIISENTVDQNASLWIDLDNSGTFELSELLFSVEDAESPFVGTITIPTSGAVLGVPLRCRVGLDADFYELSPCNSSNVGEFEDYTIILESNSLPPVANFEADILDECQGSMQFTDLSTNLPTNWLWDFGDGNTSSTQNPIHVYQEAGVYTVTLTSGNNFGSDSYSFQVTINALNPSIEVVSPPLVNTPISFAAAVPGAISWQWNFGDGTSATGPMPSHTYETVGEYVVTLTVMNGIGCQRTVTTTVNVVVTSTAEQQHSFRVYPNPSTGNFTIDNQRALPIKMLVVFNSVGQMVANHASIDRSSAPFTLELRHLPAGVYFMQVHFTDNHQFRQKLIIQR